MSSLPGSQRRKYFYRKERGQVNGSLLIDEPKPGSAWAGQGKYVFFPILKKRRQVTWITDELWSLPLFSMVVSAA